MQIKKTINEKTYVYDEKFFSGKKSLTINGKKLQLVGRKTLLIQKQEKNTQLVVLL